MLRFLLRTVRSVVALHLIEFVSVSLRVLQLLLYDFILKFHNVVFERSLRFSGFRTILLVLLQQLGVNVRVRGLHLTHLGL